MWSRYLSERRLPPLLDCQEGTCTPRGPEGGFQVLRDENVVKSPRAHCQDGEDVSETVGLPYSLLS